MNEYRAEAILNIKILWNTLLLSFLATTGVAVIMKYKIILNISILTLSLSVTAGAVDNMADNSDMNIAGINKFIPNEKISCRMAQYPNSEKSIPDWFVQQAGALEQDNPKYPKQTRFQDISVPKQAYVGNCRINAEMFVGYVKRAVEYNRTAKDFPDYKPYDISKFIRIAHDILLKGTAYQEHNVSKD